MLRSIVTALLLLSAPAAAFAATAVAPPKGMSGVFYDGDYEIGSPKAKVTVEEYGSAVCSHCARFDAVVFPELKAKYIDTGKIRYVFREFLTPPESVAASAFIIARCAGKTNYFKVVEDFFKAQPEMASGAPGSEPVVVLMRIAKAYGVDADRFHACLSDERAAQTLGSRLDHAIAAKVDSTPTIIVNGKLVEPGLGEWSLDKISPAIDNALRGQH